MPQRSRVILVEPNPRYDLTAAEEFGDIVYLSKTIMTPFNTADLIRTVKERLVAMDYDPETDYVCMTGYSLTVAMFLAVAVRMFGEVKIVMFDARNSTYKERRFNTVTGDQNETLTSARH